MGGLIVFYEYANRLAVRGHEVTLIHGYGRASIAERYGVVVPERAHAPKSYWFPFDGRVNLLHVREFDPAQLPPADVALNLPVYEPYPKSTGLGVSFYQGFGLPLELTPLSAPTRKVVVSRWLWDVIRSHGVREADMAYVPNGVDHTKFRVLVPIEHRRPNIAMLWNDAPVKRAEFGLTALERVRATFPEARAVVYGIAERPSALPRWIEYHHLPSQSELASAVYNAASVFICPSAREGFYLPGLEAMACGTVFVSTDCGGVRDYAEHEVTALISDCDTPEALAENALRLLRNPALRIGIAQAGVERAKYFSWDESAVTLEAHLRRWLDDELRGGSTPSSEG